MSRLSSLSCTPESVRVHGEPLRLTALEFVVLHTLVKNQQEAGRDLTTHIALQNAVAARFPKCANAESNTLNVIISRLRIKLRAANAGVAIVSLRCQGYQLVAEQAVAA